MRGGSRTARGRRRSSALLASALVVGACADAGPREALFIQVPPPAELFAGDFLTLSVSATSSLPPLTWSSSDERVAVVVGGTVEARRPGRVTVTVSAPDFVPAEVELSVVERPGGYSADGIDYFTAVAFGAEFGGPSATLRRWRTGLGPRIRINGSPDSGDRAVLDGVIAEINALTPLDVGIVTDTAEVEMHFVPEADFQSILPEAPTGNIGIVWLWWDGGDNLDRSVVLIATDQPAAIRAHVIREEITQMLGLLRDSVLYPESIFYQGFSTVTAYLPIDRVVIELLYRPELRPGMGVEEAAQVARTLLRAGPGPLVAARGDGPPPGWWAAAGADRPGPAPGSAGGSAAHAGDAPYPGG